MAKENSKDSTERLANNHYGKQGASNTDPDPKARPGRPGIRRVQEWTMTVNIKLEPKGEDVARAVRNLVVQDFEIHAVLASPSQGRSLGMRPPINDTTPPVAPDRNIKTNK